MEEQNPIETIIKEYLAKRTTYAEFSLAFKGILEQILADKNIRYQHISHREKDPDKLREKIIRKRKDGKVYKELEEIEDLSGVRIVFYLESEKKRFLDVLYSEFRQVINEAEEKYKRGGYRATHLILKLDKSRSKLTEYSRFKGLKCELQITSSLYHAWSEVEHDISYKQLEDNAEQLKELGLDELQKSFEKVMEEHIQTATHQLDYVQQKHKSIIQAGGIFSSNFIEDIQKSSSNDEIHNTLEIVEEYFHKKPEETLAIVTTILSKTPLPAKAIHIFKDGKLYGKTHKDLMMKCLELIENLRYMKPDNCLDIVAKLLRLGDKDIQGKAREILKKFTEYNYNLLTETKVGYAPQRKVLDYMLQWSQKERFQNMDFIETASKELLSTEVEGTSNPSMDTLTFHHGTVDPTDFLKQMRKETLDILIDLFKNSDDLKVKLKLIHIFRATSQSSFNSKSEKVTEMLKEDNEYLAKFYRTFIFKEGKTMTDDLALVAQIEKKLYWVNRSEGLRTPETLQLRKDILDNNFYHLFDTLAGDPVTQREGEEKSIQDKVNEIIKKIDKKSFKKWSLDLNAIANQKDFIEYWHFGNYKLLLRELAKQKPDLAQKILTDAYQHHSPIKSFLNDFLNGFRDAKRFDLWDLNVEEVVKSKDIELVKPVIFSLNPPITPDTSTSIRDKDLKIFKEIVNQAGSFSFLKKNKDLNLHFAVLGTITRNYSEDKKLFEDLLFKELSGYPEYAGMYMKEISLAMYRNTLNVNDLGVRNAEYIKERLIQADNLDWDGEQILLAMGKVNIEVIFDVFQKRIKKEEKIKEKIDVAGNSRYEPIPYHINPALSEYVTGHPKYISEMVEWVEKMTWDWSIYNWNVSHFLQRMKGPFKEILMALINKGDDDSLMKAARSLHTLEDSDLDISLEIIKRTKNKGIINQVEGDLRNTGVVMGEYGIAEAYEAKAKSLEPYLKDKNKLLSKFAQRMVKSFKASAIAQRQRSDEERGRREVEFEAGK